MKRLLPLGLAAFAVVACDSSSSKDPETATRDALNPPRGLTSVTVPDLTKPAKIQLRWLSGNVEDDFKGYHVFAVAKTRDEIKAAGTIGYPEGATLDSGFPRCKDNSKIFEAFGFAERTSDCEGGTEKAASTASGSMKMADDAASGDKADAAAEKIENAVTCEGNTDKTISLPITGGSLVEQVCNVTQAYNPTSKTFEDLQLGTTYTFFVVAVSGDEKNVISWTSNFIEDTPAKPVFSGNLVVEAGNYYMLPGDKLQAQTVMAATDVVSAGCQDDVCKVNVDNAEATLGIYFGRLGTGNFPQRTFISVPAGKGIALQLRGPQTYDPRNASAPQPSVPNDQAVKADYITGTKFPVYGNQVFDIMSTASSKVNYGKIVIGQPTLEAGTDATSKLTIPVTVIMQPKVGSRDYFR